MTLPTSRPISLGQVCTEFGAPSNTHLGAFVRGGAYVPDTTQNAGVPSGLPISLGDLLGASAYTNISISSQPSSKTQNHTSPPRPANEAINMSTSMTTTGGNVGSIAYSIVDLSGNTGAINVSVSGNGTHSASVTGTGNRGRLDGADYSVTFRVRATDGTSSVTSNYITFTDNSL